MRNPSPQPLDREMQIRKQNFYLLDRIQKQHDFHALVEMNGERCASRQIYDLRVYDWLGKAKAA